MRELVLNPDTRIKPDPDLLAAQAKVFKALGHPSRLAFVQAVASRGELCVCELQELAGSDMSTVSKHLAVLREAGVLTDERRGQNVYYSLALPCVASLFACMESRETLKRLGLPPAPSNHPDDSGSEAL